MVRGKLGFNRVICILRFLFGFFYRKQILKLIDYMFVHQIWKFLFIRDKRMWNGTVRKSRKFILTLFWQKFRESNGFTRSLIWRNIFSMRVKQEREEKFTATQFFPSNQLRVHLNSRKFLPVISTLWRGIFRFDFTEFSWVALDYHRKMYC